MKIYLAQHGEAVDKTIDPDRPLSGKGKDAVRRVASMLARAGATPERIVHSGKTRAAQTAEIFRDRLGVAAAPGAVNAIGPLDPVDRFAAELENLGQEVLVCGHQPFMGRLVAHLLGLPVDGRAVSFEPGSVARLDRSEDGDWTLCWFVRPDLCPGE